MKSLSPNEYAEQVWHNRVTGKTIRNWIKKGVKLKGVDHVEKTPTNQYALFMKEPKKSKAQQLAEMLAAKAKAA